MALYAISDLHLSFEADKPMGIFGEKWINHEEKIKENWLDTVNNEDTVLIAGDISWSMKMEDGKIDLEWIHNLPGRKILIKGNHDYWWTSISKLNSMYQDMKFIQNNYFSYGEYAICGTRGWILPEADKFTEHDKKIYDRELIRLKLSLESAKKSGFNKFIVMIHYPPIINNSVDTGLLEIFNEYSVDKVIYGHIHNANKESHFQGNIEEIEYSLTSCDYLDFAPVKIL